MHLRQIVNVTAQENHKSFVNLKDWLYNDDHKISSGFSSSRTYLSPFTKDIRGEDQSDESHFDFSVVPLLWGNIPNK